MTRSPPAPAPAASASSLVLAPGPLASCPAASAASISSSRPASMSTICGDAHRPSKRLMISCTTTRHQPIAYLLLSLISLFLGSGHPGYVCDGRATSTVHRIDAASMAHKTMTARKIKIRFEKHLRRCFSNLIFIFRAVIVLCAIEAASMRCTVDVARPSQTYPG